MDKLTFNHYSEEWIEKLTCPMEELSSSEREVIATHILICPDCHRIVTDFTALPWLLEALPTLDMPPGLPPKLLQLWQEEDRNRVLPPVQHSNPYLPITDDVSSTTTIGDLRRLQHYSHDFQQSESTVFERLIEELME